MQIKIGKFELSIGKGASNVWPSFDGSEWGDQSTPIVSTVNNRVTAEKSNRGWVYDCVNLISNRTSSAQLELYRKRGDEEIPVTDHPFLNVWNKPNAKFSGRMLRELEQSHLELAGEGFQLKVRNGVGKVSELWPLIPSKTTLKYDKATGFWYYEYEGPNGRAHYPDTDVIALRYAKPSDPLRGEGPLQAVGLEYDVDREIERYYHTLFKDGGWFHFGLATPDKIQPTVAKQVQDSYMQAVSTRKGKFRPPIFQQNLKPVQLSSSALDLGTQGKSDDLRDKILAAFGVPKALLGMLEGVMRANMEGVEYSFMKNTIQPRLDSWIDGLIPTLAEYDTQIFARFKNVIPKDKEAIRIETEMLIKNGLISVEEARERHGFSPDFRAGDTVQVPFNMIPSSKNVSVSATKSGPTRKVWTGEQKDAMWKSFASETEAREKRWIPVVAKWIDAWEKDALKVVRDEFKAVSGKYAGWSTAKMLKEFKAPEVDESRIEEMILIAAGGLHYLDLKEAGESAVELVGIDISFDMADPRVVKYLGDKTYYFAKRQTARLAEELRIELRAGFAADETIVEIEERVRALYRYERGYKAERIARTEVIGSSNQGRHEGYKQSGVEKKSWLSARDGSCRDSHLEADQRYTANPIPIDEDFVLSSGATCDTPGNTGDAAEDINCRCTELAEVQEE